MSDYDVEIKGIDEAIAKYGRFDAGRLLHPVVMSHLEEMQGELAEYPAPPPGSTYVRTGTLGRLWVINGSQWTGLRWYLRNATPYVRLVEDKDEQRDVHRRTGWPTWQSVVARHEGPLAAEAEEALAKPLA